MAGAYEVKVVKDRTSFTKLTLNNAVAGEPQRIINYWGTFDFQIPTLDAQAKEVCDHLWGRGQSREIQLWRDGKCIWWGVPVIADITSNPAWTRVQCYGLEWVLSQLFFGPIQHNYALNSDFEQGLVGWTAVNCSATIDTSWHVTGTQSARLASFAGADSYLGQLVNITAGPDQPLVVWGSGVYRIKPSDNWSGPPLYERGLYLARLVSGVVQGDDYVWEPITEDVKRDGSEVQVATPFVTIPAAQTQTIEMRAYCPGGAIGWDHLRILVEESVSTAADGDDVYDLLARILQYAQDPTRGKFPLNIGFAGSTTGHRLPLTAFQFYDNGNIWEAISGYVSRGFCDVGIVWNDAGTQRTFTVWPSGGRGTYRPSMQMDLSSDGRVTKFGWVRDSTQAATKVRAIGQGQGATIEIGEVTDTSQSGGVLIERVINTPVEDPVGALIWRAQAEIDRAKRAVDVPRLEADESQGALIGVLDLGDTVPVVMDFGWVQENGTRRVVGIAIDTDNDVVKPTVN